MIFTIGVDDYAIKLFFCSFLQHLIARHFKLRIMGQVLDRRDWLRQATLTIGGMSIASEFIARLPIPGRRYAGELRLHANENPYGPSNLARKAMAEAIGNSNCYPWEVTTRLREKIAGIYGLNRDNIMMGAGSSEILGIVAQHAALKKGNAIAADPTFGIWFTSAQRSGLDIIKVPLDGAKKHDLQRMKEHVNDQTRLVYICNPNNPTGTVIPSTDLKNFISEVSKRTLILLDEAYTEYSDETSLAALVKDNPNLVIAKTFSKIYGLAGARIGYAMAQTDVIRQLNELQPWANAGASAVSLAGAIASLDDHNFVTTSKEKNSDARDMVSRSFGELQIPYIPSHTNFLYYSVSKQKKDLLSALAANNIRAGRITEANGSWSRISIGTADDMKQFLNVVKQSFQL